MSRNRVQYLTWVLLSAYIFVVCFGRYFRFGAAESGLGVSTCIFVCVILLHITRSVETVFKDPLIGVFAALALWCGISAVFYPGEYLGSVIKSITFLGYVLFAASIVRLSIQNKTIVLFALAATTGLFLSSAITIVDYFGVYNFSGVNESYIVSKVTGDEVQQAGGFYSRRSAMAAYYSLLVPFVFVSLYSGKNILLKAYKLSAVGVGFLALFLTHNRSGILAIIIALIVFMLIDKQKSIASKARVIVSAVIVVAIALTTLLVLLPEHFDVYANKLGRLMPGESQYISQSDYARVFFFQEAMKGLLTNPMGHGFGLMYTDEYGFLSPHNMFTYVVYASGFFAFFWLYIFMREMFRKMKVSRVLKNIDKDAYYVAIGCFVSIVSWLVNNMAHNSFSTGLFWLFMGLLINYSNYARVSYRRAQLDVK